jgi:hypothetical protein
VVKTKELMGNFNKDTMPKACCGLRTKIEAVVEIHGDIFE